MFHLAYFMQGSSAQAWHSPWAGSIGQEWSRPDFHIDCARALERAKFDYVLYEDLYYVPDYWKGTTDIYVEQAISVPRLDTMVLTPVVAHSTSHIGVVPTLPTFAFEPYLLARQVATLDLLSQGRGAWNVVTGTSDGAIRGFGKDQLLEPEERYQQAGEFVDVVKQLWNSWEPDAIVNDVSKGVFADPSKVHVVDFQGEYYKSKGALVSGPTPQGTPVIAQAGASAGGLELAAKHADTIVGVAGTVEGMKAYRDTVRELMVKHGRNPDDCKILFLINPVVAATQAEVDAKVAEITEQAHANIERELADHAKRMGIDISGLPLDEPLTSELLEGLHTRGHISHLEKFVARANGRTLRQVAFDFWRFPIPPEVIGTFDQVADRLEEIVTEVGGDGFLISPHGVGTTRRYVMEITEGLVPVLQRRGLTRTEYSSTQLRENLLAF